jgi:hypothetical protein
MNTSNTLWMGDIENWMEEEHVFNIFKEISILFYIYTIPETNVKSVKLIRDRTTGQKQGKIPYNGNFSFTRLLFCRI